MPAAASYASRFDRGQRLYALARITSNVTFCNIRPALFHVVARRYLAPIQVVTRCLFEVRLSTELQKSDRVDVTVLESFPCTTYHSFMSPLLYHEVRLTPLVYTTLLFPYIYYP
jgi:hypothetical protein